MIYIYMIYIYVCIYTNTHAHIVCSHYSQSMMGGIPKYRKYEGPKSATALNSGIFRSRKISFAASRFSAQAAAGSWLSFEGYDDGRL